MPGSRHVSDEGAASVGWRQLREFAGVRLDRSFVLSWHLEGEMLVIDADLCLEPEHPFYEKPRPAEIVCIRPAAIEFPYCSRIRIADQENGEPYEYIGKIGLGAISDLRVSDEGQYEIRGEFGTVFVSAERPILRLKGP